MRFEPGDSKTVTLVSIAGNKMISGGNSLATGYVDLMNVEGVLERIVKGGFGHVPEPGALEVMVDTRIGRETYISMFGPTVGDRVRLGDTALWIEVEHDEVSLVERRLSMALILCRRFMATKSSLAEVCSASSSC